jgi:hypothetical protein
MHALSAQRAVRAASRVRGWPRFVEKRDAGDRAGLHSPLVTAPERAIWRGSSLWGSGLHGPLHEPLHCGGGVGLSDAFDIW